ncbi:MAG: hypothetical protein R3F62_10680 [Planctomycetota bacterium]
MLFRTAVAALAALTLTPWAVADDAGAALKALLEQRAPSIVTVRCVIKTEISVMGQSQDQESRANIPGVVVDASGLVMISGSTINGGKIREMLAGMVPPDQELDLKITPSEIKVVIEGDDKEYEGFIAASDARLDLAFVQIEGLGERTLTAVDFAGDQRPEIGQQVVGLSRLGEGFDYAPHFELGRVNGKIKKPRTAWTVEGVEMAGLPVFGLDGAPLGVMTLVSSGVKPDGGGGMFGGMFGDESDPPIIPAVVTNKVVRGVIQQAKARAVEVARERAGGGEAPPQEETPATPEDEDQ